MEKENKSPEEFLEEMEYTVGLTYKEVNYKNMTEMMKQYRGYASKNVEINQLLNKVEQLINQKY